jgi:hypothetical protein
MAEVSGKKVPLQNESTCESYKDPSYLSEIISGGLPTKIFFKIISK